jgi:predicted signal transduction protein with EAL and GGDEF domain
MMRDQGEEALRTPLRELTGLFNRRRFFILTDQYLKVAIRTKKGLLLLYIDMDNLKWINDHHGHNEGDQILIDLQPSQELRVGCNCPDWEIIRGSTEAADKDSEIFSTSA